MRIGYTLREQDLEAFSQHQYYDSPTFIRQHHRFYLTAPVILMVAGLLGGLGLGKPVFFALSALGISWLLWSPGSDRRRPREHAVSLYREGENRSLLGPHVLVAEPEGLRTLGPYRDEALVEWSAIERIEAPGNHLYVYVKGTSALIVPEETVSEGSYSQFRAECERRTAQHRARLEPPGELGPTTPSPR